MIWELSDEDEEPHLQSDFAKACHDLRGHEGQCYSCTYLSIALVDPHPHHDEKVTGKRGN